jgi:hypothetical protein
VSWGELSIGRVVCGASCHGASCPWGDLSMGRFVLGASCPWAELSLGRVVVGRVLTGRVVRGASCLGANGPGTICSLQDGWGGGEAVLRQFTYDSMVAKGTINTV